jgi:hypothetical protein
MLAEHTFVTTLDADEALGRATGLLQELGFAVELNTDALEARRGKRDPARARNHNQLPQSVRLEFDRGRITAAVGIRERRKADVLHRDMVTSLARALESHLAHGMLAEEACAEWNEVQLRIKKKVRRGRLWAIPVVILLVLLIGFIIVLAIVGIMMG